MARKESISNMLDRHFANGKVPQSEIDAIERKSADRRKHFEQVAQRSMEERAYRGRDGKIRFRTPGQAKAFRNKKQNKGKNRGE